MSHLRRFHLFLASDGSAEPSTPKQEDALNKLFFELCPNNTDISDVLLKAATLNDFYSTNIFSIYDSYVDEVLRHFRNRDRFSEFQNSDLRDYIKFKSILIDFRAFYGLDKFNLKQIDQYIWLLGKEYFPKNYGKKKEGRIFNDRARKEKN